MTYDSKKKERERERTWHSGGEGDCVNWARGSDPSFFLFFGGNYDLFSISLADPSGRRQTCLFLKGCVFVQRVRKWIAKTLTFRLSCHRGICSIGCGEKTGEKVRERERERKQRLWWNYLLKGGSWPSRATALYIYYIYFPVILDSVKQEDCEFCSGCDSDRQKYVVQHNNTLLIMQDQIFRNALWIWSDSADQLVDIQPLI